MKRKQIREMFKDKAIVLFPKYHMVTLHDTNSRKYFGTIYYGNFITFKGKKYDDVDELISDIHEYNKTLKWPAEVYDPMMKESYRRDLKIKLTLENYN